ncbi:TonB-dependent receptor [Sphingomonas sp. AP4-R1]|uniref:TonB-dependent receptor plug domain-containing protein n=1 Tax=Sphingomonas sp. AP4-R1 TaxID=2735134 RepID=UPI001493A8D7|nr:TonB-dependent receptor [Sphingomonas sp. AP4-R1]QJU59869.1 TonB-dependent receptor [Sphingomonas sp. AP4-R1]
MTFSLRAIALAGATLASPAFAQDAPASDDSIVVLGTRTAGRPATDSPAPVDVYSGEDLMARGMTDLPRALQFIAPSFNYPRSATAPSAANTRAATLRGLSPDEVLVLVNGKRWHASSVINFNNVIGRGSAPIDLATIPLAAIARIEVLRDGAAAQYGSDAIAGVINIVLKSDASGGSATAQAGRTGAGDGALYVATVNKGLKLGAHGSLNLTAELRSQSPTNRVAVDSRYGRITGEQGDPDAMDINTALNARYDLGGVELYGDATYSHRRSTSPAQFRAPGISVLYPNGFIPHIRLNQDDAGGTFGLRGAIGGWKWDLSDTIGYNDAQFLAKDTANTSLGAASPTRFDAGGARYFQNVANLTLSRPFALLAGANVAVGVEHRHEHYSIRSGEAASFTGAGAQGFPGFNPPSPVSLSRNAVSAFLDAELKPVTIVTLGGAVRYEHYSDFGSAVTGKVSALVKPASFIALRATGSTGFRAPSLQQSGFSTVTSQSSGGVLVNVGTFAVDDPVARALGAQSLKREKSRSISGGVVLTPGHGFTLTADVFHIKIDDRIALSDTLSGAAVTAVLRTAGITNASQVRFFTNALDTTTDGYEIVAGWRGRIAQGARLSLNAGYARAKTDVDRLAANTVVPALPLLGTMALDLLTTAQPRDKVTGSARLDLGPLALNADVVRFGRFKAISLVQEQVFSAVTTVDLVADVKVGRRFTFGVGVLNLGNVAPDRIVDRALSQGGSYQYPEVGGIGTNGREFFARASMAL